MKDGLPSWLKHATAWALVALLLFLGVEAWQRQQAATRFVLAAGTLEIRRAADGHYHWPGRVNGRDVDFLVDTGATGTALPASLARELALESIGRVRSQTAGGVVEGTVVQADLALEGGVAVERLRMVVLPQLQSPLLGMDVLSRLRWQQQQGVLRIEIPPQPRGR